MGLFDIFRRKPRLRAKQFAARYGLRYTRSDNPVISGSVLPNWWVGELQGVLLTMRDLGSRLEIIVGEMLPAVDYVLARVDAKHPLPSPGSELRLDTRIRAVHPALTRWIFSILPHDRAEFAVLEHTDVLAALDTLSGNVSELAIYRWGVEMRYPTDAEETALHRDIGLARRIRAPMEKYRQAYIDSKHTLFT